MLLPGKINWVIRSLIAEAPMRFSVQVELRRQTSWETYRCLLVVLALVTTGSRTALADPAERPVRLAENLPREITGDPYDLSGKRIVFCNWYYVRPGFFTWKDATGKNVSSSQDPTIGPWDAQLELQDVPQGIRIAVQQAQRSGPIIPPEEPWERQGLVKGIALLHEEGKFRLWAKCTPAGGKPMPCIYESTDGLHWKRPTLNLVEYDGSTANNLLPMAPRSVFIDPTAPDSQRYKGVSIGHQISRKELEEFKRQRPDAWEHRADRGKLIFGIHGYVSPDGIVWKKLPAPLVIEHSDTDIVADYDLRRKKYVLYTRNFFVGPQSHGVPADPSLKSWLGDMGGAGRRAIGRSESRRFDAFPLSKLLMIPDSEMLPSESLYTNCKTTIPGAPDQQLMFPAVWDISKDTTKIVMASSHDGEIWNFVPGGAVLETASFGQWDGGCLFAFPNLVELPDGSFVLPYSGYNVPHKYPRGQWKYQIGYAVWPKGRIVALEAAEHGEFATVRIMPPGRKLLINAVTERAGSIRVEVADRNGQPLAGRTFDDAQPIQGDQYRSTVAWRDADDLGYAQGQPIIMRFRMNRAKIFALEFE